MKNTIGIDIGGTGTKLGLVSPDGTILCKECIPTAEFKTIDDFVEGLAQKVTEHINPKDWPKLKGIGIGAPNANVHKGTIEHAPNLPWKGIVPLGEKVAKRFGLPCVVTNDANAAALGEKIYGAAKGMDFFIVLTMGTGLGSGIVSNGNLIYGYHGFAGELGHVTVNPNGRECGCGKRGCLETYVSATGIRRTVYKMLADMTIDSPLRHISFSELDTKMITEEAAKGDKVAIAAFEYTGRILGTKLADFIVHTDPQAIFLSGGLAKAGKYIFEPAQAYMDANVFPPLRGRAQVLPSGLNEQDGAILGASSLVV